MIAALVRGARLHHLPRTRTEQWSGRLIQHQHHDEAVGLAKELIETMGLNEALDIARRNRWDGVVAEIEILRRQPRRDWPTH